MTNVRSKFSPPPYAIDRDYPHQVALPDDLCIMRNYTLIRAFLEAHSLTCYTRRVQAVWPSGKYQDMRLHCFADRASAETFQAHFGGEFFNPAKDREKGRVRGAWRREGVFTRLLVSGPLSVPEDLRN